MCQLSFVRHPGIHIYNGVSNNHDVFWNGSFHWDVSASLSQIPRMAFQPFACLAVSLQVMSDAACSILGTLYVQDLVPMRESGLLSTLACHLAANLVHTTEFFTTLKRCHGPFAVESNMWSEGINSTVCLSRECGLSFCNTACSASISHTLLIFQVMVVQ